MSEAKHTPGPWGVVVPMHPLDGFTHAITAPIGAVGWALSSGVDAERASANARLMAAAPDMLAALQAALPILSAYIDADNFDGHASRALRLVADAIAKAQGQTGG
jgi:hypothetical protein